MKKLLLKAVLVWTVAVTVARSIRWPNDFAEAHWLLDYRFGFIKRGLVGTSVALASELTGVAVTVEVIGTLSTIALLVMCLALSWIAIRVATNSGFSSDCVLVALLFLSSPFVMISGHLIGYLDQIVISLSLLAIYMVLKNRPWIGAIILGGSMFVHEVTLLIGLPSYCLLLLRGREEVSRDWRMLLHATVPIGAFLVIAVLQMAIPTDTDRISLTNHLANYTFIREDRITLVPDWHAQTFLQQISSLRQIYLRVTHPEYYLMVMPTVLATLYFIRRVIRNRWDWILVLSVFFLPQIMHLVAWDSTRIWTLSIFCAFTALWVTSERFRLSVNGRWFSLACAVGIFIHVLYATPLMDDEVDHTSLSIRLAMYAPTLIYVWWKCWENKSVTSDQSV